MKKRFYLFIFLCFIFIGSVSATEKPSAPTLTYKNTIEQFENEKYYYDVSIDSTDYMINETPTFSINGYEMYYVGNDECIANNSCELVSNDVFSPDYVEAIGVDVNSSLKIVARAYVLDNLSQKVFSDYSNVITINANIKTPTLENGYGSYVSYSDGVYLYDLSINRKAFVLSEDHGEGPDIYTIDGYELCEKGANNCRSFDADGIADVHIPANTVKTYYAKAYVNKGTSKLYSGNSNELTIDTTIKKPIFSNGYWDYENPASGYNKPFVGYEDGKYLYDLKIDHTKYELPYTGSYEDPYEDPDYFPEFSIDGYTVCEKGTNNCKDYDPDGAADTWVKAGRVVTYVAKAFVKDSQNNKIYSAESNDLVMDTRINAPLLDAETLGLDYSNGEYHYTNAIDFDKYKYLNQSTDELEFFVDGYDVCLKNSENCTTYDMEDHMSLTVNLGETKTFIIKVFSLASKSGTQTLSTSENKEKIYGEEKEIEITNTFISPESIVQNFNKGATVSSLNSNGNDIKAELSNDKIVVSNINENNKRENIISFVFNGESLTYSDVDTVLTRENAENSLALQLIIQQMTDSIFDLSGFGRFTLVENAPISDDDSYVKNGLLLKGEEFEFKSGNEEVEEVFSGTYIRNFKISLDKTRIASLVNKYGELTDTTITNAPTLKISKGNNNSLVLNWNKDDFAEGYIVYRSEKSKGKFNKIATIKNATYTDKKLTYGKTYYYKVKAYNRSSNKTSTVVHKKVVPNKVVDLKFKTSGSKKIVLSWKKESVSGYEIYSSIDNKKWNKTTTTATKYTFKNLKSNKKYYYKVRAYKIVNGKRITGSYSSVLTAKTAPAPSKISITNVDYKTLKLKITSVSGAKKYLVYRSTKKNGTYSKIGETDATSFKDKKLTIGKTYFYKVKACNSDGKCGDYSKIANKMVVPGKPSFSVTTENKKITMSVTKMEGSDGYEVYMSNYKNSNYSLVKKLTKKTEYSNESNKGTYFFKVRAYKTVNGKKVYGIYSDIQKVVVK